jgi:hypothetical protein
MSCFHKDLSLIASRLCWNSPEFFSRTPLSLGYWRTVSLTLAHLSSPEKTALDRGWTRMNTDKGLDHRTLVSRIGRRPARTPPNAAYRRCCASDIHAGQILAQRIAREEIRGRRIMQRRHIGRATRIRATGKAFQGHVIVVIVFLVLFGTVRNGWLMLA